MTLVSDEIRVAIWNVEHNGFDPDGSDERRHRAYEVMARLEPHIVLRQEETNAWHNHGRIRHQEAQRLGLTSCLSPMSPDSRTPAAVLYDPALFTLVEEITWSTGIGKPMAIPVVRMKGTSQPLSLASVHLCPWSPQIRAIEASRLTVLGEPGKYALFGGDMNSYPHRTGAEKVALPNWSDPALTDAAHFQHRTVERDGKRVSDTVPDEILAGGKTVFTELGHLAGMVRHQPGALDPTASLWRRDQGPRQRIDRLYCTPNLSGALISLEVVADDEVTAVSDHALLLARFDRAAMQRALTPVSETPEESRA
ncbi:endonuclease/exonuclease/phosphatase family protein [Streptomyces sp. NPDC058155]|uniref:endonuclease/exonuclease/phosphatase family protein n=1 Tax=Streptomyces sp. NPDC058155 TaxID=3346359 RepID=UPI0036EDD0E9